MSHKQSTTLGRGLDVLFGQSQQISKTSLENNLHYLSVDIVYSDPNQPRKSFKSEELKELSESIREKGVLQPIIVKDNLNHTYTIIAGERRWRAAKLIGLKEIPALIRSWTEAETFEIALIENIQRENLTPLEEASGYQRLIEIHGYTQEKLAQTIKKSRSYIANCIRLLSLSAKIQDYIISGQLSISHARTLINHPQAEQLAEEMIERGFSVRDAEKVSRKKTNVTSNSIRDEDIQQLEKQLTTLLKLDVILNYRHGKGDIKIRFNNLNQLDSLIEKMNR